MLSPLSNVRSDDYGGSLENRLRWPLRVAKLCREAWADKPLFVRISASDWADELGPEKGADGLWKWWGVEQSKTFVGELEKIGIDLVDVSSGGLWVKQKITLGPGYQVKIRSDPHDDLYDQSRDFSGSLCRSDQEGAPGLTDRLGRSDHVSDASGGLPARGEGRCRISCQRDDPHAALAYGRGAGAGRRGEARESIRTGLDRNADASSEVD